MLMFRSKLKINIQKATGKINDNIVNFLQLFPYQEHGILVTGFKKNKQNIWHESSIWAKSKPGNSNMGFILLTAP